MRILLAGMVAGQPGQGGATWAALQYFEGLRSLGHDVMLVEPVSAEALRSDAVARYFRLLGLPAGSAALLGPGGQTVGAGHAQLARFADGADVLLNISGMLRDERLLEAIDVRAFVDLDPGFNQVWHSQGIDMGLDLHTHFITVGTLLGTGASPAPGCGREWIATLPPVALEHWPAAGAAPSRDAFTTVGHWRSYGSTEHDGVSYGQRAHSLRGLIDLPRRVRTRIELALGIDPAETSDLDALRAHRWTLLDPGRVAPTPGAYRSFVRSSKAELCIAKSGYVASRCGWFSDRSACYLASSRPVLAQRTGFERSLPTGEGLLAFDDAFEAAAQIEDIESRPRLHARAARAVAEEHLDARRVLARLLDKLGSEA